MSGCRSRRNRGNGGVAKEACQLPAVIQGYHCMIGELVLQVVRATHIGSVSESAWLRKSRGLAQVKGPPQTTRPIIPWHRLC